MTELMATARLLVDELRRRDISVQADKPGSVSLINFEFGGKQRQLRGVIPDFTPESSIATCRNKLLTQSVLSEKTNIPLPVSCVYHGERPACDFLSLHKVIVVKPQDGAHGRGVTVGVDSDEKLSRAVMIAKENSSTGSVVLQRYIPGKDVRVLVINGRASAAAYRVPASVTGDGVKTVRELIEEENISNPNRGDKLYDKQLNKIDLISAERFLDRTMDHVLEKGETMQVVGTANVGTGGEIHECLDELPDNLKEHAVAAANAVRAFVCGVDFIYDKDTGQYCLIELNSSPSLGIHVLPSSGRPRDVISEYIDAVLSRYTQEVKDGRADDLNIR